MFIKYPSIENSYRTKEIASWLGQYPDLGNEWFVAQEKIDGANIQIVFFPNESYKIYSRNQEVDWRFYNVGEVLSRQEWKRFFGYAQFFAEKNNIVLRLYGELFGQGIQNRVHYCDNKNILFFDASIGGNFLCYEQFCALFSNLLHEHFCVPILSENLNGLECALSCDEKFDSLVSKIYLGDATKNVAEGIVLKPKYKTYQSQQGSVFYLKKKNEKFAEKIKTDKLDNRVDEKALLLKSQFAHYVNENRVLSVFSKQGQIAKQAQIGDYIRLVIADAREDFEKDVDVSELTKDELKIVYNVGGIVVNILKKYL